MSESIEMSKTVQFHGFQLPKLKVYPAPELHDFAMKCKNFLSRFMVILNI